MSNTGKIGYMTIPLANIDYVYEGDGTSYSTPYIMLKSGKRIEIRDIDHRSQLREIIKQLAEFEGGASE